MTQGTTLVPTDWAIPDQLSDRIGSIAGRQCVEGEGHLVASTPPGADETGRRGRFFGAMRMETGKWPQKRSALPRSTAHLNEYRTAIEQLEQAEDAARQSRDYFELLDRLVPLARRFAICTWRWRMPAMPPATIDN